VVELLGYPEARLPEISGFTSHIAAVAGEKSPLIDRGSLIPIESVQGIALRIHIANCGTSLPSLSQFFTSLFCRSWIALVSFRKVRGLMVFFPFLKFIIAHLATPDWRQRLLVENCFASIRI
jgi:hypothetical protein